MAMQLLASRLFFALLLVHCCWTVDAGGGEVMVTAPDSAARQQPNRLSTTVRRLANGDVLSLGPLERRGDYFQVQLPDGSGAAWIHKTLVRPLPGLAGAPRMRAETSVAPAHERARSEELAVRHLAHGRPFGIHERHREGYSVGVDARLRIPAWVQYVLRADDLTGDGDREESDFRADSSLPDVSRAGLADYRGSGFDRGHMAPAADMKRSQQVMDESFLLSNIAPQVGRGFNRDIWRLLEEAVRDWVNDRGELTIITGPIFASDGDGSVTYGVVGENEVAVPRSFFKIVFDAESGEALAFDVPNESLFGREFGEFLVSIDQVESRTGLDLLSALPDDDEERIESRRASEVWTVREETHRLLARAAEDVRLSMIEFDKHGRLGDGHDLERLVDNVRQARPTHLFLLSHGWNNSFSDAVGSYQAVLSLMGEVADGHPGTRPQEYRPFVVGVHWPSKAWDDQSGRVRSLQADEDLTLALMKVLPAERSPETYVQDVIVLRNLLRKPPEDVTQENFDTAWEILRDYSSEPPTTEDRSVFDAAAADDEEADVLRAESHSIADLVRIFTFWEMKKRAGLVGGSGGRQLLEELMLAAPDAQVHLGGHSFGAKFWLAALTSGRDPLPRAADSLSLVQGAVSAYAFADRVPGTDRAGGYRAALGEIDGPVIATFSTHDWALGYAYPLGSRLARQTGELERAAAREPSRWAALGATGAAREGDRVSLQDALAGGQLGTGLWSVDGSEAIRGHSEFYEQDVARLFWLAINARRSIVD